MLQRNFGIHIQSSIEKCPLYRKHKIIFINALEVNEKMKISQGF